MRTSSGLIYARSIARAGGELELTEIGNSPTAGRIADAAARLGHGAPRLLLVPSRQVIALWDPDRAKLAVALSAAPVFAAESTFSEQSFEALLAQVQLEIPVEAQAPQLRDQNAWEPPHRRTVRVRQAEGAIHANM